MPRDYHIDIARHAAQADAKWVDNILSHFDVPGASGGRQGVARRVTETGIYHIVLIRRLTHQLNARYADAVALAAQILASETSVIAVAPHIELRVDREAFIREVDRSIAEAVESVVPARRGRPPKRPQATG